MHKNNDFQKVEKNSNTHFYNKLSTTKNYISKKKRNCHYK